MAERLAGGMPSSVVAFEEFVRGAVKMEDEELTSDVVRRLANIARDIKADFGVLLSAKEAAESKLSSTFAADEKRGYELASAREQVRAARDQLLDSREEADRLRAEVTALRLELENRRGKRTLNDPSDCESEEEELVGKRVENIGSGSKRFRLAESYESSEEV
jgi:cysteinyl-tRNA synthetase